MFYKMSSYSKSQYDALEKRRKFAWGKYYEEINSQLDIVPIIVNSIGRNRETGALTPDIPSHITKDYYDMAVKINKKFTCPICLDMPTRETIAITMCGHIYCKSCLDQVKETFKECSICKKKLFK